MLIDELESAEYLDVIPFWEDQCNSQFDMTYTANRAGYVICTHYVKQMNTNEAAIRGNFAEDIYALLECL